MTYFQDKNLVLRYAVKYKNEMKYRENDTANTSRLKKMSSSYIGLRNGEDEKERSHT